MSPFLDVVDEAKNNPKHAGIRHARQQPQLVDEASSIVKQQKLCLAQPEEIHDLIGIGFGPASLAIAVALSDALDGDGKINGRKPRVCFLEKQHGFAWHAGMLLPGSRMQISFIKDLATLRDPRSEFTFLNYLRCHSRLVQFSNLGTFLPSREEFADYMKWCAGHFVNVVEYGQEVLDIVAEQAGGLSPKVKSFSVTFRSIGSDRIYTRSARNVVVAIGGIAHVPAPFPPNDARIIHSSQYSSQLPALVPDPRSEHSFAVVGGGQSSAEIFHDLHQRYPESRTALILRDTALRPSDDSPFVNEVFDPKRTDEFYNSSTAARAEVLKADRSTNYGVVRIELLEQMYHKLYQQRVHQPDEQKWRHRILNSQEVAKVSDSTAKNDKRLVLTLKDINPLRRSAQKAGSQETEEDDEILEVDAILLATGYVRSAHEDLLKNLEHLRLNADHQWHVRRDYKVEMNEDKVSRDAGIWLQGCNESTHGLSDTLLSTLATRGGEVVQSIFGGSGDDDNGDTATQPS